MYTVLIRTKYSEEAPRIAKTGGRGLSGEHIQLCAEGARRKAESLRQMDRDAYIVMQSSPFMGVLFCFLN